MASSTSRPPQQDAHPMSNDNNNHNIPVPTTENKNGENSPGNAEDNKNNKNTDTNDNNDDDNKNNKDKTEHDGTEEVTNTGTDTETTTTNDEQLNTATHERNDGTENESNNMGSNTVTPIERKGGAHKGNIITSHHMRIQDPDTTETQQRKNPGKVVESTEPNSEPKIPSTTGINNSDMDSWADFSTDDEHMESPNNSDNDNRSNESTKSRIEEMITFEHPHQIRTGIRQ